MKLSDDELLLVATSLAAIVFFVLCVIFIFKNKITKTKLNKKAEDNLGKPLSLDNLKSRLFLPEEMDPIYLLKSFVPNREHPHPYTAPYYVIGSGFVSNPKYPNNVVHTKIIFLAKEEIVIDGKYKISIDGDKFIFKRVV